MAVSSIVKKNNHKYGIKVPKNLSDAYRLDKVDGDDYWRKAISK